MHSQWFSPVALPQSLEVERRRVDDAAAKAAEASREVTSRIAALEEERSGLEKQLKQEKVWRGASR